MEKKKFIIDPEYGMAGDMLSAALISLGAPPVKMIQTMQLASKSLGNAEVQSIKEKRSQTEGIILNIKLESNLHSIEADFALSLLENLCRKTKIDFPYKNFVIRAMEILTKAEKAAHNHIQTDGNVHHTVHLHEAQDIIIDLAGAAIGLECLNISMEDIICLSPVNTGGGTITFSHGTFSVPSPATTNIINDYNIPVSNGPVEKELFTPTGASILAALKPKFINRKDFYSKHIVSSLKCGIGFGSMDLKLNTKKPNALYIYLQE